MSTAASSVVGSCHDTTSPGPIRRASRPAAARLASSRNAIAVSERP
jgi:hypothetical protein